MKTPKNTEQELGRLQKRSDFLYVQGQGKKWVSKGLVLQVAPNPAGEIRIGYTVTKKISKKAVVRNRIKRRLRALAADIMPFYAARGYDYVLVGRRETFDKDYASLQKDLKWCLKRLELMRPAAPEELPQKDGCLS